MQTQNHKKEPIPVTRKRQEMEARPRECVSAACPQSLKARPVKIDGGPANWRLFLCPITNPHAESHHDLSEHFRTPMNIMNICVKSSGGIMAVACCRPCRSPDGLVSPARLQRQRLPQAQSKYPPRNFLLQNWQH